MLENRSTIPTTGGEIEASTGGAFCWQEFLADFTANQGVLLLTAPDVSGGAPDGPG